jgi:hypothetical protein
MSEALPGRLPPSRAATVRLALLATLGAMCVGLSGEVLYETVKDCTGTGTDLSHALRACVLEPSPAVLRGYAWSGALALAFLLLSLMAIPSARRAFLRSHARMIADGRKPRFKAVIFALSRQHGLELGADGLPLEPGAGSAPATRWTANAIAKVRAMQPGDLDRTLDQLCDPGGDFAGWQWQQPLRMLRHNRGRLSVWCAILTAEAGQQLAAFRAIADPLLDALGARLEQSEEPVAPFDYNDITRALDAAIHLCHADLRCSHAAICIDMTGGTAAFSAAATVKTLNSQVRLGYVVTAGAPNAGEIVVYEPSVSG